MVLAIMRITEMLMFLIGCENSDFTNKVNVTSVIVPLSLTLVMPLADTV